MFIYIYIIKGRGLEHKTSLTLSLFMEVPATSQEIVRSCICVLGVSNLSLFYELDKIMEFFRKCDILELFRQCGILELFRQCGILELFGQCGILYFSFYSN